MNIDRDIETKVTASEVKRSIGHDAVTAAVASAAGGVAGALVNQVVGMINRPKLPKPESPLILPPSVGRDGCST